MDNKKEKKQKGFSEEQRFELFKATLASILRDNPKTEGGLVASIRLAKAAVEMAEKEMTK